MLLAGNGGMNGIHDQITAIRWVRWTFRVISVTFVSFAGSEVGLFGCSFFFCQIRREIANFGGDPDRLTIFGDSAGGYSVCTLAVSPLVETCITLFM